MFLGPVLSRWGHYIGAIFYVGNLYWWVTHYPVTEYAPTVGRWWPNVKGLRRWEFLSLGPTPLSNTQGGDKQGKSGQEENNFYFSFLTDAWWSVKMLILLPNTVIANDFSYKVESQSMPSSVWENCYSYIFSKVYGFLSIVRKLETDNLPKNCLQISPTRS